MFDLPRDVILPVDTVDVRLDASPHPFEAGREGDIRDNWEREIAAKPALFDGEVALLSALSWRDRVLAGRCHIVRYSTFLLWRREQAETAGHCFAHAMPVSSDNALIAARMGDHTLNAGRVYFAAGSFEPDDFRDGQVDPVANMRREVLEETGLDLNVARGEAGYHMLSTEQNTVIVKRYYFSSTAEVLAGRIAAHIAGEAVSEISSAEVIRSADAMPAGISSHMVPLVAWHYGAA